MLLIEYNIQPFYPCKTIVMVVLTLVTESLTTGQEMAVFI